MRLPDGIAPLTGPGTPPRRSGGASIAAASPDIPLPTESLALHDRRGAIAAVAPLGLASPAAPSAVAPSAPAGPPPCVVAPPASDVPRVLLLETPGPSLTLPTARLDVPPAPMAAAIRPIEMRPPGPVERALTRLERNPAMFGVSGALLVKSEVPGLTVDVPRAAVLARSIARELPSGALNADSFTRVRIVPDLGHVPLLASSPSGRVERAWGRNVVVDTDPTTRDRQIFIAKDALRPDFNLDATTDRRPFRAAPTARVDVPVAPPEPVATSPAPDASVFCGGLISISAEPPEGFFAASTAMELGESGHPSKPAAEAEVWIYRVPDSRRKSYFDFTYAAPDRPTDTPRAGKFKIASGVGPASDPTSPGGAEADLLWLGDEQHGALSTYLETLARPGATVDDLRKHKGLIHRLSEREVLLSGADQAHAMTKEGFNSLKTDPSLYRRVYSEEYDRYLHSLFSHPADETPAAASYLLATSRGCTQGCTLCSSGGLKAFQYFTAPRVLEELEKIHAHAAVDGPIDVYFLDSNLNNNPERLIELADLYEKSPLKGKFRFYCRHSTPNGFLKMSGDGDKKVNEDLVRAYRRLGLSQVFMGIDTYDDASTLTLKSNRNMVARKGDSMRPTYRATEIRELISVMEREGLESKGFFLTNNPWVTDLDRLDAYYNVLTLWLENAHFSIDSRYRDVMRLKPFEGSPIQKVADERQLPVVEGNRFAARGILGEMDEAMTFEGLGTPRARGDVGATLREFGEGIARIRREAEALCAQAEALPEAEEMVQKIIQRDAELRPLLEKEPRASDLLRDIDRFAAAHADLPPLAPAAQKAAFLKAAEPLFEGLRATLPLKMEKPS
jgi:hypothetical protein